MHLLWPSHLSECLALRWSDVDWLNGLLRVERGIVEQNVDDVKTDESRKSLAIADELLVRLKVWKQTTEFPADSDWISPVLCNSADCRIPTLDSGESLIAQVKQRDSGTWARTRSGTRTGCG